MNIHIGNILKAYIKEHKVSQASLARALGTKMSSISNYKAKESIQSKNLLKLCEVLKHNFFADIASQLPASYSTSTTNIDNKQLEIESLKKENERLQIENNLLRELLKGKDD
jgi:transcriptional regulator with XRE-family HTH domain